MLGIDSKFPSAYSKGNINSCATKFLKFNYKTFHRKIYFT